MDLKPNMYRVTYKVMEGNNYAGGWGTRTKDIEDLGDVCGIRNLVSVKPIFFHEFDEAVPESEIAKAIAKRVYENHRIKNERDVEIARVRLSEAEAKLNR